MTRPSFLPLLLLCLLAGCHGTRNLVDPIVQIQTKNGRELGVTTDYGIVFLGRTAQSGPIEVTAWFGDGPSVEDSTIEPVSGDIYTAETEILLPPVPLLFIDPGPGEWVAVQGRTEVGSWREVVKIVSDPRIRGLILEMPDALRDRNDQIGAGVFRYIDGDSDQLQLLGLISGRVEIETATGIREYATVMGPLELWRLVTLKRSFPRRRPQVYRDDIL
ncbi:MAG: hypothetical protein ACI9F9_001342 [Candidatus Paceibacteria bacterium]|jgi:hypothetical protein